MKQIFRHILAIFFTLYFCLTFSTNSSAQQWISAVYSRFVGPFSSAGVFEGTRIASDAKGNIYASGDLAYADTLDLFIIGTVFLHGNRDSTFILAKYDSSGNVKWVKNACPYGAHGGYILTKSVACDKNGNVYVSGFFDGDTISLGGRVIINVTPNPINFFIAKFNPDGNILWVNNLGGYTSSTGENYLSTDTAGNLFLLNDFNTDLLKIGSDTLYNTSPGLGKWDIYLAKYDSSGNFKWAKQINGVLDERPTALTVDVTGNAYIAGRYTSPDLHFGSTVLPPPDSRFVAEYDVSGSLAWVLGDTNIDINGLVVTYQNSLIMTGEFNGKKHTFSSNTVYNADTTGLHTDFYVARYNPATKYFTWAKSFGTPLGAELATGIALDAVGNVWVSGSYNADNLIIGHDTLHYSTAISGTDGASFLAQFDQYGAVGCTGSLPAGGDDISYITADSLGYVYLGADFETPFTASLTVGSTTMDRTGSEDMFIAKFRPCIMPPSDTTTYYAGQNNIISRVEIYPNPARDEFVVSSNSVKGAVIELFNISGRLLKTYAATENETIVSTAELSSGIYICKFTSAGNAPVIKKLIVIK